MSQIWCSDQDLVSPHGENKNNLYITGKTGKRETVQCIETEQRDRIPINQYTGKWCLCEGKTVMETANQNIDANPPFLLKTLIIKWQRVQSYFYLSYPKLI